MYIAFTVYSRKPPSIATNSDLYKKEAFDNGFHQYFKNLKDNKISKILNNPDRNVKMKSITYRQLNSWEKEGLLTAKREGKEWRRFSIIDAVWLKIVKELREFGLGRDQVKIAKSCLEFGNGKYDAPMPLLEFYIAFLIGNKMPVKLLVLKEGIAIPCSFTQYRVAVESVGVENHIQISLNKMIQEMFPDFDLEPVYDTEVNLDMDEIELLAFLRIGNYEKVEISYSGGRMKVLQGMERVNASSLVSDVIKQHKYQKIEVEIADGKKVSIIRTVKKKLNKKG